MVGRSFCPEGFPAIFPIANLYCKMLQSLTIEHLQTERTMGAKDRARILAFLRQHKSEMQSQFGVTSLGLVGSCARDEAREDSDIDLVVNLQSENTFRSFFGLLHFLQDNLHERIDLATEASLKPLVREAILQDIHYV